MLVIRPVTLIDLDALLELSQLTGFGLTTLPRDRTLLQRRIRESNRAFEKHDEDPPGGEVFLFVLEDLDTGRVVGTAGVASKVGGFEPFYAYKLETQVIESTMLNVRKEVQTLHLVTEHNGPCEIGSLFLRPEYRRDGNGRLLSLSRFLFMAQQPHLFDPMVIAEMRGVIDARGRSAFWDALGKHFFDIEFPKADYLSMVNKRFIAELMPRHPIYVALLPAEAQAVIGQVHDQTRPALNMLRGEGFTYTNMVDIFEAGPIVSCPLERIRGVSESQLATVAQIDDGPGDGPGGSASGGGGDGRIIGTTGQLMRACKGMLTAVGADGVKVSGEVARALGVNLGDKVRYVSARPAGKGEAA